MTSRSRIVLLSILLFVMVGALAFWIIRSQRSSTREVNEPSGNRPKSATVLLGGVEVKVEVAETNEELRRGLAGRKTMTESRGMLFVFNRPGPYAMTMEGMLFPLDILWIRDGRVIDVAMNLPVPRDQPVIVSPDAFATTVLEVNAGFVSRHGITIETPVTITFDENTEQ